MPSEILLCFGCQSSELYIKFPLRACSPGGYFSTLSSKYQHADIVAKHSMCSRFDVCMYVNFCMFLCPYECLCYGTAGGLIQVS